MKTKILLITIISLITFSCNDDDFSGPREVEVNFEAPELIGDMSSTFIDNGISGVRNNVSVSYVFDINFSTSAIDKDSNVTSVTIVANVLTNNGTTIDVPIKVDLETFNDNNNNIEGFMNSGIIDGGIDIFNYLEFRISTSDGFITTYRTEPIL